MAFSNTFLVLSIINSKSLNTIVANVNSINKVNTIISSYIDKNENIPLEYKAGMKKVVDKIIDTAF